MKKKFAVCFSGYPRFVKKTFPGISENLLKGLGDYDIYAHFQWTDDWKNKKIHHCFDKTFESNELEDFIEVYTPFNLKKINVIKPYNFDVSNYNGLSLYPGMNLTIEQSRDQFYRSKCQYQGIVDCINLIDNLEDYEYFIRIRSDLIFEKKLELKNFDSDCIVNQNGYIAGWDRKFCDWFFICPRNQLNFFKELSNIEHHYKDGIVAMHSLVEELGIPYNMKIDEFNIQLPFKFYSE
jgi:hypothetical protein